MIHAFISSLRHIVLDIGIKLSKLSELAEVDFSPLGVLGAVSQSISRIDLYVHTGILTSALTLAQVVFSLEGYEGIPRLIEEGIMVIHSEKVAPYPLQTGDFNTFR